MRLRPPVEMLVVFAPMAPALWLVGAIGGDDALARQGVVWVAYVAMLALAWLALRRDGGWAHIGARFAWPGARSALGVVARGVLVFVLAALAFALGAVVMAMIVGRPEQADLAGYAYLRGNLPMLLLSLAGVYVVSSFGEEALFRGYLMTRCAEWLGGGRRAWHLSAVVSAVLFGLIHYEWGLAGVVQTTLMGAVLAWAWLRFGRNLWINVVAHAILDTVLLLPLYFG